MDVGLLIFSLSIGTTYAASYLRGLENRVDNGSGFISDVLTVSCPGKVLVCGGYLVLESANIGVTIATNTARFYVSVCSKSKPLPSIARACEVLLIEVLSLQFRSTYKFLYDWNSKEVDSETLSYINEENLSVENKNVFVQRCLALSLSFIRKHLGSENFIAKIRKSASKNTWLSLTLEANNDFYSQVVELKKRGLPLKSKSLAMLPEFLPCPVVNGAVSVQKTGLGSSAAMVTALVGALLKWFGVVALHDGDGTGMDGADILADRRLVHNLAQLVHANAQGKIGSGFDVAAAVYGT
mmetsp:Transcript_1922/g.3048  ORF Transcript_1922/g.3048 Transcript_1922/m.3048 type:complete len:297 (+) Transcript_1922:801-1691(+)